MYRNDSYFKSYNAETHDQRLTDSLVLKQCFIFFLSLIPVSMEQWSVCCKRLIREQSERAQGKQY